jgi:hypothetical protein
MIRGGSARTLMATRDVYRSFGLRPSIASRYRASQRRLQRIRWRDHWSLRMWLLLIGLIIIALMAPQLAELHEEFHRPTAHRP